MWEDTLRVKILFGVKIEIKYSFLLGLYFHYLFDVLFISLLSSIQLAW